LTNYAAGLPALRLPFWAAPPADPSLQPRGTSGCDWRGVLRIASEIQHGVEQQHEVEQPTKEFQPHQFRGLVNDGVAKPRSVLYCRKTPSPVGEDTESKTRGHGQQPHTCWLFWRPSRNPSPKVEGRRREGTRQSLWSSPLNPNAPNCHRSQRAKK